jgi:hypothetical protein
VPWSGCRGAVATSDTTNGGGPRASEVSTWVLALNRIPSDVTGPQRIPSACCDRPLLVVERKLIVLAIETVLPGDVTGVTACAGLNLQAWGQGRARGVPDRLIVL